jgi:hypothetical protein
MGAILVALIIAARLLSDASKEHISAVKAACSFSWKTALLLLGYGLCVFIWRQSWTPSRGTNDNAMFLPLTCSGFLYQT